MKYPEPKSGTVEMHEDQSQGWWFPNEMVDLFTATPQILNAEELILLGKIKALQKKNPRGCFASNRWLAGWWKHSKAHTSRVISQMVDLGILEFVDHGGHRYLKCLISEGHPYAKMHRGVCKNAQGGMQKCLGHLSNTNELNKKVHCPEAAPHGRRDGFFKIDDGIHPFIKNATEVFEDYVRTSRKISCQFSRPKWYKEFELLLQFLEGDKKRFREVMVRYINTPHDQYTPIAESAESFRKKFLGIETWTKKQDSESAPSKITSTKVTSDEAKAICERRGEVYPNWDDSE